jgi:hypothetical protein
MKIITNPRPYLFQANQLQIAAVLVFWGRTQKKLKSNGNFA